MLKFFIAVGPIYLSSHYTKKILVCIVLDNNLIQRMSYKFILSYIFTASKSQKNVIAERNSWFIILKYSIS